ncbi:hypothetical protein PENANT_c014G05928 [Penicillium antarcticum]|uniref:Dyp-type peroxidase n=1 Tax=Penicillium antarcticum TaxID=416450 RepID=A0A1V6Q3W8_9EURO|nr:hypothetical protein PENANT_c014G05928 [Penicillium antarcticum]
MVPNLNNIQGDIWPRLAKKYETFLFFEILDMARFKKELGSFSKYITTAKAACETRGRLYSRKENGENNIVETISTNISLSAAGLARLGKTDLGDFIFKGGMYADMVTVGLDRDEEWHGEFKGSRGQIDGVFILAGSSEDTVNNWIIDVIKPKFADPTINGEPAASKFLFTQSGAVLNEYDVEHFGWKDGASQPLLKGLDDETTNTKGPGLIKPGYIILGEEGDTEPSPDWAKDGSFMVFRRLRQLVPEFTQWVVKQIGDQAKDGDKMKLGVISTLSSRLVGRWPDGAPLDLMPGPPEGQEDTYKGLPEDAPGQGEEHMALTNSNDFDFRDTQWQDRCPFASHIRKVRPRADRTNMDGTFDDTHAMIRRGISFGPLTTNQEKSVGVTTHDRGLLFVSYQANLHNGFRQVQNEWANKISFPPGKARHYDNKQPGLDPIIGQWAKDDDHSNYITMPRYDNPKKVEQWKLERSVIAEGGEYFFSPSISGIREICGVCA